MDLNAYVIALLIPNVCLPVSFCLRPEYKWMCGSPRIRSLFPKVTEFMVNYDAFSTMFFLFNKKKGSLHSILDIILPLQGSSSAYIHLHFPIILQDDSDIRSGESVTHVTWWEISNLSTILVSSLYWCWVSGSSSMKTVITW